MVKIHPTALVDPAAELGVDVEIGPFSIVEADARVGDRCRIASHVVIHSRVTLGSGNFVDKGAVLGGDAQDLKCQTPNTYLVVGDDNVIREFVTMHRGSHEGEATRVGSRNFIMANAHFGHDAIIGNDIMFANAVSIGGHCQIDDRAVIGGHAGCHQRVRVGTLAMVQGTAAITFDVPPYTLSSSRPFRVVGTNTIGLQRNGVGHDVRRDLHKAIRLLFCSGRNRGAALAEVEAEIPRSPQLDHLIEFVKAIRDGHNGRQLER